MRRILLWMLSTVAAVVLLFSYRTSTMGASGGGSAPTAAAAPPAAGSGSGSSGSGSSGSGTGASGGGASGAGKTYDGSTAQTRWGPVQVRITVDGRKITDVTAVTYPTANRRDQQINAYALPRLRAEVLAAQSAKIDTVSGATVTSEGYIESLQAALDAANIG
ncbi:FMN-binding protein [Dactylosporangium sp. CA-233914]|uniref:FMN-binding protein n=1 Tax=Dactylosporangium sp. CA-233914 TaxID=3239934 RepID=UPI003D8EDBFF